MQMRTGTTLLMSAYLSAMLATSVASPRRGAELAATIDPGAARGAFDGAVSGMDAGRWLAAVAASSSPAVPVPVPVPIKSSFQELDPITARERMARLIIYVSSLDDKGSALSHDLCSVLNLCEGKKALSLRLGKGEAKPGDHYMGVRADAKTKDVLIMVVDSGVVNVYLTDASGVLRAAAVKDGKGTRLVTNESAAAKYKIELDTFLAEAASLPPTGQTVAGNG